MVEKSSAKKTRSSRTTKPANSSTTPRKPSREKGKLRFEALVDATEALLTTEDPDSIGLYQIAEKAKVAPASVYHFFPTKEAAFTALMQRHVDHLTGHLSQPIEANRINSWAELTSIDLYRSAEFHNSHPPLMKVTYGGFGGVETRDVDLLYIKKIAEHQYARWNKIFYMPRMSDAATVFAIRVHIIDSIFGLAYQREGKITEKYIEEAYKAIVAYLSLYIPPQLEPRELLLDAQAAGESLSLPYGDD